MEKLMKTDIIKTLWTVNSYMPIILVFSTMIIC